MPDDLLQAALKNKRKPQDVQTWAETLAADSVAAGEKEYVMPEQTIDERMRELREAEKAMPDEWLEYSRLCVRHMPAILDALERQRTALEPFASAGRILPKDTSDITDLETLIKVPTKVKYYIAAREALNEHQ